MFVYEIILIILGLGGLYISNKIRVEKKQGKKMVCPLHGNCQEVLSSDFSKMVGIPLEILGIGYYLITIFFGLILIFIPSLKFSLFEIIFYGLNLFGFIFSIYLVSVQIFSLKNWCTWCLFSSLFSFLIFISSTIYFNLNIATLISVMKQNSWFFVLVNIVAYALGTSLAIVIEVLTLRFLKDFKIDHKEKIILMYLWQILWSVIFFIVISSFAIFIFHLNIFDNPFLFKTKTIIFLGIMFVSAFMSFYILPKLDKTKISCNVMHVSSLSIYRGLAIMLSTIIFLSWLINLFINQILTCPCDLNKLLIIYIISIIGLAILTNLFFQYLDKKTLDKKKEKRDNKVNGQI